MAARGTAALAALLLCALLTGCTGKVVHDPELLHQARIAAQSSVFDLWAKRPERVRASITPKSTAMFPVLESDLTLTGVYRNYRNGETKFALALPQGTLIGSCVRSPKGEVKFQSLSPLVSVGDLARASFDAMDEFLASAPKTTDTWRLQQGDVRGGIHKNAEVLVRRRQLGLGSYINFVYDLNGRPLVFYQITEQSVDWRLHLNDKADKISYTYRDYNYDWRINVEIIDAKF